MLALSVSGSFSASSRKVNPASGTTLQGNGGERSRYGATSRGVRSSLKQMQEKLDLSSERPRPRCGREFGRCGVRPRGCTRKFRRSRKHRKESRRLRKCRKESRRSIKRLMKCRGNLRSSKGGHRKEYGKSGRQSGRGSGRGTLSYGAKYSTCQYLFVVYRYSWPQ
jgi:hypothetical protein